MSKVYVKIDMADDAMERYERNTGRTGAEPIALIEQELVWLRDSGLEVVDAFISDEDDDDREWYRYINYVANWAFHHYYDGEEGSESPRSYHEFKYLEAKMMMSNRILGLLEEVAGEHCFGSIERLATHLTNGLCDYCVKESVK